MIQHVCVTTLPSCWDAGLWATCHWSDSHPTWALKQEADNCFWGWRDGGMEQWRPCQGLRGNRVMEQQWYPASAVGGSGAEGSPVYQKWWEECPHHTASLAKFQLGSCLLPDSCCSSNFPEPGFCSPPTEPESDPTSLQLIPFFCVSDQPVSSKNLDGEKTLDWKMMHYVTWRPKDLRAARLTFGSGWNTEK